MNIEDRIRSRIEAILLNDVKNHAEVRNVATEEDPMADEAFAEERNLYQRIINNYRNAVAEVNHLFEENVGFLSGFFRTIESIKGKTSLEEISSRIVDGILQDFGAEYCALMFFEPASSEGERCSLEGIREERKVLRVHSNPDLMGSAELEAAIVRIAAESSECLNIADVYRDSRFDSLDFPGVVRSLVCLPVTQDHLPLGALVLSHSLPRFFNDNHIRILKILAAIVAHLRLLTGGATLGPGDRVPAESPKVSEEDTDVISIVLLDFEWSNRSRRPGSLEKETVKGIRKKLIRLLGPRESIVFNADHELILFLPGVGADGLHARVSGLREAFQAWRSDQGERLGPVRMNVGFATCEEGEDLSRTLEIASQVMHPDLAHAADPAPETKGRA